MNIHHKHFQSLQAVLSSPTNCYHMLQAIDRVVSRRLQRAEERHALRLQLQAMFPAAPSDLSRRHLPECDVQYVKG